MENPFEIIIERLDRIEKLLENNHEKLSRNKNSQSAMKIMTINEVASYLDLSVPTIYGYTAKRYIPHAKRGNRLYFDKNDIDKWILEGKKNTISEIENMASEYMTKKTNKYK